MRTPEEIELSKQRLRKSKREYQARYKILYPERLKESKRLYSLKTKEKRAAYLKVYNEENKEKLREKARLYAQAHKKEARARSQKRREQKPDELREYHKRYRKENEEKLRSRYKNDPQYALTKILRSRTLSAVRGFTKSARTLELLGCTIHELRTHIESLWLPGMSWENHAMNGWHIDHIKPCASFDLTDEAQQRKCFHFTNLQPLWWIDNLRKSGPRKKAKIFAE